MAELGPGSADTAAGLSRDSIVLGPGLSLPLEVITETIAILANRGAGKVGLCAPARGANAPHRAAGRDHRREGRLVWGSVPSADGTRPGLPFVIFGGDHADEPLEPTAGDLLADLVVDDRIPAVLDLSHMSKTKARTFATAFATRLYVRNRGALHVVIEFTERRRPNPPKIECGHGPAPRRHGGHRQAWPQPRFGSHAGDAAAN